MDIPYYFERGYFFKKDIPIKTTTYEGTKVINKAQVENLYGCSIGTNYYLRS